MTATFFPVVGLVTNYKTRSPNALTLGLKLKSLVKSNLEIPAFAGILKDYLLTW